MTHVKQISDCSSPNESSEVPTAQYERGPLPSSRPEKGNDQTNITKVLTVGVLG